MKLKNYHQCNCKHLPVLTKDKFNSCVLLSFFHPFDLIKIKINLQNNKLYIKKSIRHFHNYWIYIDSYLITCIYMNKVLKPYYLPFQSCTAAQSKYQNTPVFKWHLAGRTHT